MLLDIGLPKVNGYELAQQLRQSAGASRRMVLVAFTGYGQDEDRRRVREAGFDHHLLKPLDPEALEKIIDSAPATAPPSAASGDNKTAESRGNRQEAPPSQHATSADGATPSRKPAAGARAGNGSLKVPRRILIADDGQIGRAHV